MDLDHQTTVRKSSTHGTHVVRTMGKASLAMQALRDLVVNMEGIRPVAVLLGADFEDVAKWTRKGIPPGWVKKIHAANKAYEGNAQSVQQSPSFYEGTQFCVTR